MIKRAGCLLLILVLLSLSSCLPVEEAALPAPTLSVPVPLFYITDPATVEDVVYYQVLRARFVPTREEVLFFPMNNLLIYRVNVRLGDFVREGDVILELDRSSYLQELEEIIKDIESARVGLRQLEEIHALNLQRWTLMERPVDMIGYIRRHEHYNYQIDVLTIRMDNIEAELERRLLRASMDGYVAFIRSFNPGDLTVAGQRVVEIADITEAVFMVSGDGANLLSVDDVVNITVQGELYYGVVVDPIEHGITADRSDHEAYIMIQGGHGYGFTTGTMGSVQVVFDIAKEVLAVPTNSVTVYGNRAFVFVLEEELRVLRDIQVGLVGNSLTEVVSGVEEGELIVR